MAFPRSLALGMPIGHTLTCKVGSRFICTLAVITIRVIYNEQDQVRDPMIIDSYRLQWGAVLAAYCFLHYGLPILLLLLLP